MTRLGVDYSTSRPGVTALRAAGYTFACRYLAAGDPKKNPLKALTKAEADALRAGGIDLVSNWETSADRALDGRSAGVYDAQQAAKLHAACGGPPGRPIYFSVDFDASEAQQPAINAYFQGVSSVIGLPRTGAYGGYWVVKRLFDGGLIRYGWQTYAWSGGNWDARAQLRQVQNGITVGGADCDRDEAMVEDFGQWGYEGDDMAQLTDNDYLELMQAVNRINGMATAGLASYPVRLDGGKTTTEASKLQQIQAGVTAAAPAGGLTDADRKLITDLTTAVAALNSRLATP